MSETQLKNGKRNGISKNYYSNGELFYIAEFKNNILDGNVLTYSKDGNILSKGLYCKGEKCGDWYYYDKCKIRVKTTTHSAAKRPPIPGKTDTFLIFVLF